MANLGEITEIVNASELTLEVGSDTYIMLTNLQIHIGRPEDRTATTDAGVHPRRSIRKDSRKP